MKNVVVLTGAGMSAESGLKTFRDADGLWEGHDVMQVASPEGWDADRELVLDFYNQRRRQLLEVSPNKGHFAVKKLEERFHVDVVTQNVDDLHERAGSTHIVHLHGELLSARSTVTESLKYRRSKDINIGDNCEMGHQLRPDIVWFGEAVPLIEDAVKLVSSAEIVLIIGTSMLVYPAAGLIGYASPTAQVFYIDPSPNINHELAMKKNLTVIAKKASIGVPELVEKLLQNGHA